MDRTKYQVFEDAHQGDTKVKDEEVSPVYAAYSCGLQGIVFPGVWTAGTNLAYMRGRAARFSNPIIDFPDAPALTSRTIIHA